MTEKLQNAIEYWKKLDLKSLHSQLDMQGMEILENQKETLANRKRLAEETKNFKRLPDEQKMLDMPKIFKSYQMEIDSLSKRLKSTETHFLTLYQSVLDIIDPSSFLDELSVQKPAFSAMELENTRLRSEVDKLSINSSQLVAANTQNTRLQERIRLLEKQLKISEQKTAQHLQDQESSSALQERISFLEQREFDLSQQLRSSETKLKASIDQQMQQMQTQAALSVSPSVSSSATHYLSQIDKLERELEDLKLKNRQMEKKLEETENSGPSSKYETQIQNIRSSLSESQQANSLLSQQLNGVMEQLELSKLQRSNMEIDLKRRISELEHIINMQNDYEDLKKELDTFKSLDFTRDELESNLPIEAMAIQKSRRLQSHITDLANELNETKMEFEKSHELSNDLKRQCQQQKDLISKLENDLSLLNKEREAQGHDDLGANSSLSTVPPNASSSMLEIIKNQRDRYMKKVEDLDGENKGLNIRLSEFQAQIEALQADNVRLYEKIKYLTSFNGGNENVRNSNGGLSGIVVDDARRRNDEDSFTSKYDQIYQAKLDPFAQFSKKEQSRAISKMSPHDRASLHISRMLFASKSSRLFLIVYTIFLHVLIFIMTMWVLQSEDSDKKQ